VSDVHPTAASAFHARADDYERARPGWPPDAVAAVLDRFGAGAVVDLAAGTGKLTRVIAEQADTVIAIEPVEGMRRVLREQLPHVRAMDGTAEAIPLPDGSIDTVFVGEALHWFDLPRALPEIARVLKPGGGLAVLYHGIPGDRPAWFEELSDLIMARRNADHPVLGAWREALEAAPQFEAPVDETFPYEHPSTRELIVAEISSFSSIGSLPPDQLAEVTAACDEVLQRHGIETYTFQYTVTVTTAQPKRPGESAG
jgi:ubiquinone/menaquinone biosynthesis C-methylase UbiE